MKKFELKIGWLYPELMSTYGDRGNIIVLQKRCEWRGISVEIKQLNLGFDYNLLTTCDFLFMGGAQDRQQQIVADDLIKKRKFLQSRIEDGTPGLYICGAYQFLGKYYKEADGTVIDGLGILDLYTENPGLNSPRLIGNVSAMVNVDRLNASIIGFENHGGRTYLGKKVKPFAKIIKGFGNNGEDSTEGAIYKNTFGTYFHGPILPKNPEFADYLIKLALERKYDSPTAPAKAALKCCGQVNLSPLDDNLEREAHNFIISK